MNIKRAGLAGVALLALAAGLRAQLALASDDHREAVRTAAERFYAALNAMFTGDLEPMKEVWSHADDVTHMGPSGGFRVGWAEVLADWQTQAALKLGGEVRSSDMRLTVGRDLAVVSNFEVGENAGSDGRPLVVQIRATNLFRNEGGEWKMIGHHTDILPLLQK